MKTVCQFTGTKTPVGRSRLLISFLLMSAGAVACSSSESTGPNGRPTGNWVGSVAIGTTFSVTINVVLIEDAAGKVTGNGYLTSALSGTVNNTAAVTATGSFVAPHLSLNLSSAGFNTMNVSGPIAGNTLTTVLNGSGFNSETMVFTRQ